MTPTPDQSDALCPLSVDRLEMTFPGGIRALRGVTLDVRPDDFLVILGSSGAGKSTLLRCMNRLNDPTGGVVRHFGRDVTRATGGTLRRLRRNVGMIFQQFNLVGRLTVVENVLAGRLGHVSDPFRWVGAHAGVFTRMDRERAMEALSTVGIEDLARQRADSLSGGQQQRVAIARTLAQDPGVILADEPIASLDPRSAEIVLDTLAEIRETRGIPVVVNLHQVEHARRYARRIVGMRAGEIVFEGTPADLDEAESRSLYRAREPETAGVA